MSLNIGDKYRIDLRMLKANLYADVHIGNACAEVFLFEGDRTGAQYGVIVQLTPQIETTIAKLLQSHNIDARNVKIFTDREAYPGQLPPLPPGANISRRPSGPKN